MSGLFHQMIGDDNGPILWWQMSLRAVLIVLFGLVLIRFFGRRPFGKHNPLDILLAVLIGSNLSRALTANAPFVPTLAATATVFVVFQLLDRISIRFRPVGRWVKGDPVWLMRDGAIDDAAMRRWGISRRDIEEAARSSGTREPADVQEAVLERSGKISTFTGDGAGGEADAPRRPADRTSARRRPNRA